MQFIALDDRQFPGAGLGDGGSGLRSPVRGISEDTVDEGEEAACAPIEDEQSAVAILHSGRVDDDVQQQAEGVDQDMPFAAGDLLGRIKALRFVEPLFEPRWRYLQSFFPILAKYLHNNPVMKPVSDLD